MADTRTDPVPEPGTEGPDMADPSARVWWRVALKGALLVACILIVAMWVGIFTGYFDKRAPGTLDDPAFSKAAESICAATKAQLDALPKAQDTTDHVARAEVVAQTDVDLRAMLDQLRAIAPTEGRDGSMTLEWLADWSTYVGNREDYASRLRNDETARFLETPKSSQSEQISKPIDRFGNVNKMYSCNTPGDMA
jgi:hypothetical protein